PMLLCIILSPFVLNGYRYHGHLPSFPTRRSSDLRDTAAAAVAPAAWLAAQRRLPRLPAVVGARPRQRGPAPHDRADGGDAVAAARHPRRAERLRHLAVLPGLGRARRAGAVGGRPRRRAGRRLQPAAGLRLAARLVRLV